MQPLLAVIEKNERSYDLEKIKNAFLYAKELHAGQFRLSGEPYVCHPVAVAEIVAQLGLDTDSICAALLHDTVEDCSEKTNLDILGKMFGKDHSTAHSSYEWVKKKIIQSPLFDSDLATLKKDIYGI